MRRWLSVTGCLLLGGMMLICGLLVPAHLKAVDVRVIQTAGGNSPALVQRAGELLSDRQLGAASMLWRASQNLKLPGVEALGMTVTNLAVEEPELGLWGAPPPLGFEAVSMSGTSGGTGTGVVSGTGLTPVTDLFIQRENRERALELLGTSRVTGVRSLLNSRDLTNTLVFSPSQSASGQAFDVAVVIGGLLLDGQHLAPGLRNALFNSVLRANDNADSEPLERILLDLMSLGQRLNWGQLTAFVAHINDTSTLHVLADRVRNADGELPVLFGAVELSEDPSNVASYLTDFGRTGLSDLRTSLRFNAGGLKALLRSHKQLSQGGFRQYLPASAAVDSLVRGASALCLRLPWVALAAKWLLYLLSGFLIAAAMHFARRPVTALERPLEVRGFHLARESLFALGYLLLVLLLSEPFLSQGGQKVESHLRLRLPAVGGAIPAKPDIVNQAFMNQANLLTLLVFFVLQGLIYTACLIKLAEIRRQRVPPHVKLRLLENEEHLFDAGLYLGFVGTIVSLILVSMGITHFSLMAAYSSTSFGIVFVSFFKIFHLRGARRKLLLQAEGKTPGTVQRSAAPSLAVRP